MQHFYLDGRAGTKHHALTRAAAIEEFPSLEAYQEDPGTKLDMCVDVLNHHIKSNGAPVLKNVENVDEMDDDDVYNDWSNNLVPSETVPVYDDKVKDIPDKIIIYQAFPSHNIILRPVSILIICYEYLAHRRSVSCFGGTASRRCIFTGRCLRQGATMWCVISGMRKSPASW